MIDRVRHLKWREAEADLGLGVKAGKEAQEAINDIAKEFPEANKERFQELDSQVMGTSAVYGVSNSRK